jgi:hypothetical protein
MLYNRVGRAWASIQLLLPFAVSLAVSLLVIAPGAYATTRITPSTFAKAHHVRSKQFKHMTDQVSGGISPSYATYERWDHIHLTYGFENGTSDIAGDAERQAVRDGMKLWTDATPVTFSEVPPEAAEIRIKWTTGAHGDEVNFESEIFAHTIAIPNGDIHFNDEETWTTNTTSREGQPVDLVTLAGHEVGHALGMLHPSCIPMFETCSSAERAALMWIFSHERGSRRSLGTDDLEGIQSLYGRHPGRRYLLRNSLTVGIPQIVFAHGASGDRPVAGDWDGNGTDTIGYYRRGDFYLRNSNSEGASEISFSFANSEDLPVAGDWDGDGDDTIGVFRPSTGDFYLRDSNTAGPAQYSFSFSNSGDIPVAGDWNGDRRDSIGVYRPSTGEFFLSNTNAAGPPDYAFSYGNREDIPVAGEWDRRGSDRIGLFRPSNGVWYLEQDNLSRSSPEWVFAYGNVGPRQPIVGDWDNDGTDTPGTVQD